MTLPHDAVGWSAVCECGISCSYSLTFKDYHGRKNSHKAQSIPEIEPAGHKCFHCETKFIASKNYIWSHSGKSVTFRESNHASGVYKEH